MPSVSPLAHSAYRRVVSDASFRRTSPASIVAFHRIRMRRRVGFQEPLGYCRLKTLYTSSMMLRVCPLSDGDRQSRTLLHPSHSFKDICSFTRDLVTKLPRFLQTRGIGPPKPIWHMFGTSVDIVVAR